MMGDETPRASVLGALRQVREMSAGTLAALCSGDGHAPPPLNEAEAERLSAGDLTGAPSFCRGRFSRVAGAFADRGLRAGGCRGDERACHARACRSSRQHTKNDAREVLASAHLHPAPTPYSPLGLRLPLAPDGRGPALAAEPAYIKGRAEIQDEGSQLPRFLLSQNQANRCSISAPARAAKLWRLPRRCKTRVRSTRPTAMGTEPCGASPDSTRQGA